MQERSLAHNGSQVALVATLTDTVNQDYKLEKNDNMSKKNETKPLKQPAVTTSYICTECGGDATIAMTGWKDNTGKNYYKKGERLCMRCHKKRTGVGFFL